MKKSIIAIFIVIIVLATYFFLTKPAVAPESDSTSTAVSEVGGLVDKPAGEAAETESITVSTDSLGDGQKKMLETFGIEGDIEITPEMIACAEEKIEKGRLDEIIGGATPSFMEGVALASCY